MNSTLKERSEAQIAKAFVNNAVSLKLSIARQEKKLLQKRAELQGMIFRMSISQRHEYFERVL